MESLDSFIGLSPSPPIPADVRFSRDAPGKSGLTRNGWTFPWEFWARLIPECLLFDDLNGAIKGVNAWNANLCTFCRAPHCAYCYVTMRSRPEMPSDLPVAHPDKLQLVLKNLESSHRWRRPRLVIAASSTEPQAKGTVLDQYRQVFASCARQGVPLMTLSKQAPDPVDVFAQTAAPGHRLIYGATVTSYDSEWRDGTIEPDTACPADRWANLLRVAQMPATYPIVTWVSMAPLHDRSFDPVSLADTSFAAGADLVVAEALHARTPWSREHRPEWGTYMRWVRELIEYAEENERMIVLKDELRAFALSDADLASRYAGIVQEALPQFTVSWDHSDLMICRDLPDCGLEE